MAQARPCRKLVALVPQQILRQVLFCHHHNHNKVTEVIQLTCNRLMVLMVAKLVVSMVVWEDLANNRLDKATKTANMEVIKHLGTTTMATVNNAEAGVAITDTKSRL